MTDDRFLQSGFSKQLAHCVEEAGEFLAAAGKTQRWGKDSVNPLLPEVEQETNQDWPWREMCDLHRVLNRLAKTMGRELVWKSEVGNKSVTPSEHRSKALNGSSR